MLHYVIAFYRINISKISSLDYIFSMFLTKISNFMPNRCNLLLSRNSYFMYNFKYKNLNI